jgi:hypothetical protein
MASFTDRMPSSPEILNGGRGLRGWMEKERVGFLFLSTNAAGIEVFR